MFIFVKIFLHEIFVIIFIQKRSFQCYLMEKAYFEECGLKYEYYVFVFEKNFLFRKIFLPIKSWEKFFNLI